jgi:putative two-component system response regulator
MGMAPELIDGIHLASIVHDIGKISVPAEILSKPGDLSPAEHALVREHAESGYSILKDISFPWPIAEIVRQHHERLDGSGYPRGLKAADILLEAQIIAVADTVDAMVSNRPYRPGLAMDLAIRELNTQRGKAYEERAVDACQSVLADWKFMASAE